MSDYGYSADAYHEYFYGDGGRDDREPSDEQMREAEERWEETECDSSN